MPDVTGRWMIEVCPECDRVMYGDECPCESNQDPLAVPVVPAEPADKLAEALREIASHAREGDYPGQVNAIKGIARAALDVYEKEGR